MSVLSFFKSLISGRQLVIPADINDRPQPKLPPVSGEISQPAVAPAVTSAPVAVDPAEKVHPVLAKMLAAKQLSPLFLDIYAGDYPQPDFAKVLADPLYHGVILKATEGNYYSPGWFLDQWKKLKTACGTRYGVDFYRGAYTYLKFDIAGKTQADFFLDWVSKAGGWDVGDLWPVIDCELGNDGTSGGTKDTNQNASAQQIIDCVSSCAARIKSVLGRQVMLYGSLAMAERNIKSRMNCDYLWMPRYTATLPMNKYTDIGWSLDKLWGWQFYGDGSVFLPNYPTVTPLGKQGDITALTLPGGIAALPNLLFAKP